MRVLRCPLRLVPRLRGHRIRVLRSVLLPLGHPRLGPYGRGRSLSVLSGMFRGGYIKMNIYKVTYVTENAAVTGGQTIQVDSVAAEDYSVGEEFVFFYAS